MVWRHSALVVHTRSAGQIATLASSHDFGVRLGNSHVYGGYSRRNSPILAVATVSISRPEVLIHSLHRMEEVAQRYWRRLRVIRLHLDSQWAVHRKSWILESRSGSEYG